MRTTQIQHSTLSVTNLSVFQKGVGLGEQQRICGRGSGNMALEEGMVNGKIQKMLRPLLKNLNLKVCLEKKC